MTDEIKKMLEPRLWATMADDVTVILTISKEDFDRLKRGFLKLMEQVDSLCCDDSGCPDGSYREQLFRELEAAMRGEG